MGSIYPTKIQVNTIEEMALQVNRLIDLLNKDLSTVVIGGGVGDVKSPIIPGVIDDTIVLYDGLSGKRIKASTIYANWFDQAVATTSSPTFDDLTVTTVNALTPTALATGFSIAGGTTSKTLTVPLDATVSGVNTGDQDLSGVGGDVEVILDKIVNGGEGEINAQLEALMIGGAMPPLSHPHALVEEVLTLTNATAFTPTADYHPATKKYVDDGLGAKQATLTFGIADTNKVQINAADVADNDYAKFTATGLEGRSYSEVLSDIGAQASLNIQTISLTAQTAAIGTTAITGTNASGLYRVSYYLEDTTLDVTAGTIMANFAYTDDAGATTTSSVALPLTALGRTQGTLFVRVLGTGSISYSTTLVGLMGSSQYALFISCEEIL